MEDKENNHIKLLDSKYLNSHRKRRLNIANDILTQEPLSDYILNDFFTRDKGNIKVNETDIDSSSESDKSTIDDAIINFNADNENGQENIMPNYRSSKKYEMRYFLEQDRIDKQQEYMDGSLKPPCFYCTETDHYSSHCPNLICDICLERGHTGKNCSRMKVGKFCYICGWRDHNMHDCDIKKDDCYKIRCMECQEKAHTICNELMKPMDDKLYCPICCGDHIEEDCEENRRAPIFEGAHQFKFPQKYINELNEAGVIVCYWCNEMGHVFEDCPFRNKK